MQDYPKGSHSEVTRACIAELEKTDLARLLDRPLSPEARDWDTWWKDLHYAAAANRADAAGVPVDARLASGVPFGERLLAVLEGLGHAKLFEGWYANGETPLMIAAYLGALDASAALVDHGADMHGENDYGMSPLHFAAYGDALDAGRWLEGRGADIHATNNSGETPLHRAAWNNAHDAARVLVEYGADIRATDNYGSTPLHIAAMTNALELARILLARGADVHAKDNDGNTPLQYAEEIVDLTERTSMKELLRSLGATW